MKALPLIGDKYFWRITTDALKISPVVELRKKVLFFSVRVDTSILNYYHYEDNNYRGIFEPASNIIQAAHTLAREHFPVKGLCEEVEKIKIKTYILDENTENEDVINKLYVKVYGDYPGGAKIKTQKL